MIAGPFRFERSEGVSRFEAEIEAEGTILRKSTVHFDFHTEVSPPTTPGDAWLAALLVPAMFSGEPLEIRAPVSRRLARTAPEIQRIFHSWYPDLLRPIEIVTREVMPVPPHDDHGSLAVFFSGGVDSWYSAHQLRSQLAALITVKGFDIPFNDQKLWPETTRSINAVAEELGAELITVETNLRDKVDPGLGSFRKRYEGSDFWGACYHGMCLGAVGLFLQDRFASVVVPASWQYSRLQPWGSHPLLDSLMSNGNLELVHHGAEASRMSKLRVISRLEFALKHLRVCPDFTRGLYNCGECEKCRRTLLALRALGISGRDLPFSTGLDLQTLELNPPKRYLRALYDEILEEALKTNDRELISCLRKLTGRQWSPRYAWHRWSSRMKRSAAKRLRLPRIAVP